MTFCFGNEYNKEDNIYCAENSHDEIGSTGERNGLNQVLPRVEKQTILKTRGPRTFPILPQTLIFAFARFLTGVGKSSEVIKEY